MRNVHVWKMHTEDSVKREVRARLFAKRWTLEARLAGETEWTVYTKPLLGDLIALREILFNKYQRKHLAWEHLVGVEKLILDRGGSWED